MTTDDALRIAEAACEIAFHAHPKSECWEEAAAVLARLRPFLDAAARIAERRKAMDYKKRDDWGDFDEAYAKLNG